MSKIVANYNGGASDEYGTFAALNRTLVGDVIEGFNVVPNSTPNMTIKVNPGSARITTGTYPSSYGYMVNHDTVGGESVTITTAAASPRIDYIVAFVDKSVAAVTSPVNNTNNVLKFAAVAGTPAGSPVVPTVSQIQAAIGAANPYITLAQIAVAASATTVTTPNITDSRALINVISNQQAWISATLLNSWVNFGVPYTTAAYMKDSTGFVHLKGTVKTGAIGTTIFNLPAGYRPGAAELVPVVSNGAFGAIAISTSVAGDVAASLGNTAYISLDGITFRGEA